MKKLKKSAIATACVLALSLCVLFVTACGTVTLPAGDYTGTYTCSYTEDGKEVKLGFEAKFTVDENNVLWYLELTNPEGYSGSVGTLPWDQSKFKTQFDEKWTVDELMRLEVEVDENGVPVGTDCIDYSKTGHQDFLVCVGYEVPSAVAILAMQNAVIEAQAK